MEVTLTLYEHDIDTILWLSGLIMTDAEKQNPEMIAYAIKMALEQARSE